jgi:hypothetical protein
LIDEEIEALVVADSGEVEGVANREFLRATATLPRFLKVEQGAVVVGHVPTMADTADLKRAPIFGVSTVTVEDGTLSGMNAIFWTLCVAGWVVFWIAAFVGFVRLVTRKPSADVAAQKRPLRHTARAWLAVGGVAGIAFLIAGVITDASPKVDGGYAAQSECEHLVSSNLKSPSTAKFSDGFSGDGPWIVSGYVDSENGFGAMLRSDFRCSVSPVSGVRLEYLTSQ